MAAVFAEVFTPHCVILSTIVLTLLYVWKHKSSSVAPPLKEQWCVTLSLHLSVSLSKVKLRGSGPCSSVQVMLGHDSVSSVNMKQLAL